MKRHLIAVSFAFLAATANAGDALNDLVTASKSFIETLDSGQREQAVLPFANEERLNWHYFPKARKGIMLKQLSPEQMKNALSVLQAALSPQGFEKVESIRDLESVLREISPDDTSRDPLQYYVTFFGEPEIEGNWGLRYEGHHLSLHWTIVGGKIVATLPQFLGSNPGEVKDGSRKGTRVLAQEEDLARMLIVSLDSDQRKMGVVSEMAPADILTGVEREAAIQEDLGISYGDLTEAQRGILISLLQVYASVMRSEQAEERLSMLRGAGLEGIKFAWMGGLERGEKHYYRIQGPTFLIEYDNTQNNANHVHTVWRDFKGDFGIDALKQHYEEHADGNHPNQHEH
jgi:hypothetical protein